MGNSGFRRLAKYGPGAHLRDLKTTYSSSTGKPIRQHVHYVVLDVCKSPIKHKHIVEYYYKLYSKEEKRIQYIQPFIVENMEQIELLNAGNLRTLLDDADNGFDAPPPAPPPIPITITLPKGLTYVPINITIPNTPTYKKK